LFLFSFVLQLRSNRDAIRAGIGYLSEDRLSLGLIQPQSIADNLVISVLDKILDGGLIFQRKKEAPVAHWIRELAVKIGHPEDADFDALRRQSAAHRHRQMAGGRAQGADPGLADGRRRCRRARKHLRHHAQAGGCRAGNPADLG
jgi:ABC-type uncharacterized transport system ATPase subunit